MQKKDWKVFRNTGTLGKYRPEAVRLNETQYGDVMTWFEDEECWADRSQFVRERDMAIGDMTFHISSVFLVNDDVTATPTDKLLTHIDMQIKNEKVS